MLYASVTEPEPDGFSPYPGPVHVIKDMIRIQIQSAISQETKRNYVQPMRIISICMRFTNISVHEVSKSDYKIDYLTI